jgi:hypothetical protein
VLEGLSHLLAAMSICPALPTLHEHSAEMELARARLPIREASERCQEYGGGGGDALSEIPGGGESSPALDWL